MNCWSPLNPTPCPTSKQQVVKHGFNLWDATKPQANQSSLENATCVVGRVAPRAPRLQPKLAGYPNSSIANQISAISSASTTHFALPRRRARSDAPYHREAIWTSLVKLAMAAY
ncbi:MAG: hypothetical protein P4N60_17435 [Verrucomicrobiae bacterium]|nr:hypothetical protein [Verrucomicrobiae bacterium]